MEDQEGLIACVVDADPATEEKVSGWCNTNGFTRSYVFEERLDTSGKLVELGNVLFKAGDAEGAKLHYLAAGYHADFDAGQQWEMTTEHKEGIRLAKIRVLLNLANAGNKLSEYALTKKACTLGLKLNSSKDQGAKFFYRRARAMLETGCLKEAVSDAKMSLEILPNDAALREVYVKASEGLKKLSADMWKGKANLFDFPHVELVLTDDKKVQRNKDVRVNVGSPKNSVWETLCCKRKKKVD
jgi:tetratricopeptide (TPR) repeat protein